MTRRLPITPETAPTQAWATTTHAKHKHLVFRSPWSRLSNTTTRTQRVYSPEHLLKLVQETEAAGLPWTLHARHGRKLTIIERNTPCPNGSTRPTHSPTN